MLFQGHHYYLVHFICKSTIPYLKILLNYLSIFFMVIYIFVILKTEIWWLHICNDLLAVSCITKEFISTHSFWITLLACVKAKESKACTWKLNWEGRKTLRQNPSRKKTQVKILQTESQNQNLFTCAVKSWHRRLLKERARPSVREWCWTSHLQQSNKNL